MADKRPVLVVDDEFYVTRSISFLLQENNIRCILKNDSTGIMEIIEQENPQVVVLDINLPGTDGFDLCRMIREKKTAVETAVIFLSARGQEQDIRKGLGLGGNEYMVKPFNPFELRDRVLSYYAPQPRN